MTKPLAPDICFIGGGSSIPHAIEAAAASGLSVVLVESGETDSAASATNGALALRAAGMRVEALRRGSPLGIAGARIVRWPYAENARARAEGATAGHIKLVVDRDGRILSASIAGANAAELIGLWAMALSKGMTVGDVGGLVLPVSTFADIGMRAAIAGVPVARRRSIGRRLAGLLRA